MALAGRRAPGAERSPAARARRQRRIRSVGRGWKWTSGPWRAGRLPRSLVPGGWKKFCRVADAAAAAVCGERARGPCRSAPAAWVARDGWTRTGGAGVPARRRQPLPVGTVGRARAKLFSGGARIPVTYSRDRTKRVGDASRQGPGCGRRGATRLVTWVWRHALVLVAPSGRHPR